MVTGRPSAAALGFSTVGMSDEEVRLKMLQCAKKVVVEADQWRPWIRFDAAFTAQSDNLQLHRSKINSDLYRPLRKHCGKIVAVKVVTRVKVVTGGCAKRRLCKS